MDNIFNITGMFLKLDCEYGKFISTLQKQMVIYRKEVFSIAITVHDLWKALFQSGAFSFLFFPFIKFQHVLLKCVEWQQNITAIMTGTELDFLSEQEKLWAWSNYYYWAQASNVPSYIICMWNSTVSSKHVFHVH